MRVLIVYHSKTGHTLEAVTATAKGISEAGSEADIVRARDFSPEALDDYDGLILGSPCWGGSITGAGIAKPIVKAMKAVPGDRLERLRCGAVSVHAEKGGDNTVKAMCKLLAQKGCTDCRPGPAAKAGVPFSVWKGQSVGNQDEERFREFGATFAA